ncbi:MAG: cupin domain-containing protein [Saprospiraceae bacterium]|nr:cupin domain-containing protein [Saprospiraceae bacterium]
MPYSGQTFSNPATGEIVEFLETSNESAGQRVRFKTTIPQGKGFEVEHFHEIADESFEVLSGTLSWKLNGKAGKTPAGASITLPRHQPHAHWNADEEPLVMIQTISPCYDTDLFLEKLFQLAMDGKLDSKGQPPFLQVMVWLRDLKSRTYLAAIPKPVQNFLAFLLTPMAKLIGYRAL